MSGRLLSIFVAAGVMAGITGYAVAADAGEMHLPPAATQPSAADEDNGVPPVLWPSIRTAVKLSMNGRMLAMSTDLPRLGFQQRRIKITDWPGNTFAVVDQRNGSEIVTVQHEMPALPNSSTLYSMSVMQHDDVRLSVDSEDKKQQKSVQFLQTPGLSAETGEKPVRMVIYTDDLVTGTRIVNLRLEANDVVELREKYPRETAEYLQPLLASLGQEDAAFTVEHRVAWQVLSPAWPIDPQMQAKVQKLVNDLDADDYATRAMADDALRKLGEPAAMVVQRLDASKFSPEQSGRLAALLATYKPLTDADAADKASDVPFLLNCLYTSDTTIRATAVKLLEKAVGHPLPLDPSASPSAWAAAVRLVRDQLLLGVTTAPTTP